LFERGNSWKKRTKSSNVSDRETTEKRPERSCVAAITTTTTTTSPTAATTA
jgi:hypothetical protein